MNRLQCEQNDIDKDINIEEICESTWKDLYRFVYSKVQNREEAEDITQETYAKAFAYLGEHKIKVIDYGSYLRTISMNIIRDQWRIKKRKGYPVNIEEVDPEAVAVADFSNEADHREILQRAMKQLTREQMTVINLRIIYGYSSAETAKLMNKKEGTVRVIQYRAIKALEKILNRS